MSSLMLLDRKQELTLELMEENWEPITYQYKSDFSFPVGGDGEEGRGGRRKERTVALLPSFLCMSVSFLESAPSIAP